MTAPTPDRPRPLSFLNTVDRRDVHRWAISEVFLTDLIQLGPDEYAAAAQIPRSHHYFTDRAGQDTIVDSMLIMECCRQAATCVAHRGLHVPRDNGFHVSDWTLELTSFPTTAPGNPPEELSMDVRVLNAKSISGTIRAAQFYLQLSMSGTTIGSCEIRAGYTPAENAQAVRVYHRKTDPSWSSSLPDTPPTGLVAPTLVGYRDARNVLLADSQQQGHVVTARLTVLPSHATHFDHPQDHYTAMILMEAARQIALLLVGPDARIMAYHSTFTRFAELDSPVRLEAEIQKTYSEPGSAVGRAQIAVHFRQNGQVVSEIQVTTGPGPSPLGTAASARDKECK